MPRSYRLLDCGDGQKLEQLGDLRVVRPCSVSLWKPRSPNLWQNADACFKRTSGVGGEWKFRGDTYEKLEITLSDMMFEVRFTPFGHLGIFPEQISNWQTLKKLIAGRNLRVLNLFGYTGGASICCAQAGASVTHVDAARPAIAWARRNAELNACPPNIRWITDDVRKFVAREIRRKETYDAVILDPPSFGRGTRGEVWKFSEHIMELLSSLSRATHPASGSQGGQTCQKARLLAVEAKPTHSFRGITPSPRRQPASSLPYAPHHSPAFILFTAHTSQVTASTLRYLLEDVFPALEFSTAELSIPVHGDKRCLPAGVSCIGKKF